MPEVSGPEVSVEDGVDAARRQHFAEFYGLAELPTDRPIGVVMGNCQAESLRLTLPASTEWVRLPPVHELTTDDIPHLERLLAVTDVLISQPVRDDYHGLPLGTGQLFSRVRPQSATAVIPVIRFAGLYPTQVIVRPPADASISPPLVPYHDLRTMAEASGSPLARLTPAGIRGIARLSLGELRSREQRHGAVEISDAFAAPDFAQMRTINHPGNPIWMSLSERVADRLAINDAPVDVGRPILNSIHAPREQAVIEAWALDAEVTSHWTIDGRAVTDDERHRVHLAWYADHPDVLAAGLRRHADALDLLATA